MSNIKEITLTMPELEALVIAANKNGLAGKEITGLNFYSSIYGLKLPIFQLKPKENREKMNDERIKKRR